MSSLNGRRRMPSLNALKAFEAAARNLSFKDAADELSVSQSAISHQVKSLEDSLGFPLFTRKTRGIELTRKGKLYYPILRNAFESIIEGTEMILEKSTVAVLTVQVYSTFTIRWLLPRLARFQSEHKDIQVRLTTAQSDVNFEQDDVDAAIMIGHPSHTNLHYDYLFDAELFPVCSPAFRDSLGDDPQPSDIKASEILQVYPSAEDWRAWLEGNGIGPVNTDQGLQLESYDVALNSAVQGMGIALGQQPYTTRDMETGSLVELFPGRRIRNPNRWYLACRNEKYDQAKLQIFRQWLLDQIAEDQTLLVDQSPE
jgi:LysR family transcriptional regulator, glycine cleavage system transcriptional activator